MDGIAQAITQAAGASTQQAALIDMVKKANDSSKQMASQILASAVTAPAAPNPPGIGQLIDVRA